MNKKFYYSIISIIFLLSFRCYSALYYPILNSDHAVNILMLYDFNLPADFYFWGQDRIGSLIPLLGQFFFKVLHFSALASEAITHYLILLAGYLALTTFIKSDFYKLILAIFWFFPPMRFIDVIELYSGVEYSIIAIACYLYKIFFNDRKEMGALKKHLSLISISFLILAAIWVSDMAIVTVFILIVVRIYFKTKTDASKLKVWQHLELFYLFFGAVAGTVFFQFAKDHSPNPVNYATFSDLSTIMESFIVLLKSNIDLLEFNGNELFTSIYFYLLMILLLFIIGSKKVVSIKAEHKMLMCFFLLDALILFFIIMLSQWTSLNGVPRRYFTCTYISFGISFLIYLDNLTLRPLNFKIMKSILLATVIVGGVGAIYNLKYFWPRTLTPKVKIVAAFEQLGQIGLIGEYWNSYINACTNPRLIKATPHDGEYVRNSGMVNDVFKQKKLYIIKDMWLKSFPDSLTQFNRLLIRDGAPFHIADCDVCKYKLAE